MANQILAGAVINAGMVIAGVDANNPPVTGSGGGGGGSDENSTPTWIISGSAAANFPNGALFVYDPNDLSASPTKLTSGVNGGNLGRSVDANSRYIVSSRVTPRVAYVWDTSNISAGPTTISPGSNYGSSGDRFGDAIAVYNDTILIGARNDDDEEINAGAIYVYDGTDLTTAPTKLTAGNQSGRSDSFGYSVAMDGDVIIVGSPADDGDDGSSNNGTAYMFDASNLSASPTKLTAGTNAAANAEFGRDVAVSGNIIVIGAPFESSNRGAIYVFDASNLNSSPIRIQGPAGTNTYFGRSVAVDGDHIVVGANLANNSGRAYLYDATNLSASPTTLAPATPQNDQNFGFSVDVRGDTIIVGAYRTWIDTESQAGTAYVFDATDISAGSTELSDPNYESSGFFGFSVTIA